ncbi:AAA family ATPase [Cumulibacter soli]|uniref:ParA family protein n=1 Tax=Cumulibacter soli TaxID=2546344 RepID=UPI00312CADEB
MNDPAVASESESAADFAARASAGSPATDIATVAEASGPRPADMDSSRTETSSIDTDPDRNRQSDVGAERSDSTAIEADPASHSNDLENAVWAGGGDSVEVEATSPETKVDEVSVADTQAVAAPGADVSRETTADVATDVATETEAIDRTTVVGRREVARILTVSNQKGGVGKTTTTVNLAAAMAMTGLRVLVIDLDPQGNASTGLGIPHQAGTPSTYNVIVDKAPLSEVVQPVQAPGVPTELLYCVPATPDLAGAEVELAGVMVGREFRLKQAITAFLDEHTGESSFDYVLVDCPPSLGLLTVNALAAAGEVLIPVQCEYYALEGLGQLLETVDLIKGYLNPALEVSTMLLTMFDARTKLAGQVVDDVREHFGEVVMRTIIPRSVKVSEAPSYGLSVMSYDPGSRGAEAYAAAARELVGRR